MGLTQGFFIDAMVISSNNKKVNLSNIIFVTKMILARIHVFTLIYLHSLFILPLITTDNGNSTIAMLSIFRSQIVSKACC